MAAAFREVWDEDDSADDIDDWVAHPSTGDSLAQPLLSGSDDEEEQGTADAQFDPWKALQGLAKTAGGLQRLYKPGRRKRGLCPVCGEAIRSGEHQCDGARWKLREGQLADAKRCEGNAHFRAGRFGEAAAAYSRALELSPEDARLWSNRSACYSRLGRAEDALVDAEAALAAAPGWFKGHFRKARILEAREDWAGVVEAYSQAAERCQRHDERAKAKRYLAAARLRCAAAQQVHGLPPAFSDILVQEWWAERQEGNAFAPELEAGECRKRLSEAEAAKEDGNRAVARGRWRQAAEAYRRGLDISGFRSPAPLREQAAAEAALLANLALAELRLGRPAEAAGHCRAVLALDPRSAKARFRLATALGELGEAEAALREVEMALVLEPSDTAVLALRRKLRQECIVTKQREKEQCTRMFRA